MELNVFVLPNLFSFFKELRTFGDRCDSLAREFTDSDAFNRTCAIYNAFTVMDTFSRRLESMEREAQVKREVWCFSRRNVE